MLIYEIICSSLYRDFMIGGMLICGLLGGVGALGFVGKNALLAEIVSHATFPGAILGVLLVSGVRGLIGDFPLLAYMLPIVSVVCAMVCCMLFDWLLKCLLSFKCHSVDTANAFIIAVSFGTGVFLASLVQHYNPVYYRHILSYMHGNVVIIQKMDVYVYGFLLLSLVCGVFLFRMVITFQCCDPAGFYLLNSSVNFSTIIWFMMMLCVGCGIRVLGIMLTGGVMIFPPIIASFLKCKSFWRFFIYSILIACINAFIGIYLSVILSRQWVGGNVPHVSCIIISMIVCGLSIKIWQIVSNYVIVLRDRIVFQFKVDNENMLKHGWMSSKGLLHAEILRIVDNNWIRFYASTWFLSISQKSIRLIDNKYVLTPLGQALAVVVVKKHRLWEMFLVKHFKKNLLEVHREAEIMEHKLTNKRLEELDWELNLPDVGVHDENIPRSGPATNF